MFIINEVSVYSSFLLPLLLLLLSRVTSLFFPDCVHNSPSSSFSFTASSHLLLLPSPSSSPGGIISHCTYTSCM